MSKIVTRRTKSAIVTLMMVSVCFSMLAIIPAPVGAVPIPDPIDTDMDITVDTTWDSGTCAMSANITVKDGATLTLDEVTINIDSPWDSGGGGNDTNLSPMGVFDLSNFFGLKVESGGTLKVINSTIQGIDSNERFNIISQGTIDIRGSTIRYLNWGGIILDGDDGVDPVISTTTITNGRDGISAYYSDPTVSDNTISNINDYGIYLTNSDAYISDNSFTGTDYYSIRFYDSYVDIIDNTFNNTNDAIRGSGSTCTIEWNDIQMSDDGVYLYDCNCSISNNTIHGSGWGDDGIYLDSDGSYYHIIDNEIYQVYDGIVAYGAGEIVSNTIYNAYYGITMKDSWGGGGGNISRASTDPKIRYNDLNDLRYRGISVDQVYGLEMDRNTLSEIGENNDPGDGIRFYSTTGKVTNNTIDPIIGNGIRMEEYCEDIEFYDNIIANQSPGNEQYQYSGAVSVRYAQNEWTEHSFGPGAFDFSDVAVAFRFFNSGTVTISDLDLTADGVGKSKDIIIDSEWTPSVINLVDTYYDDYQIQVQQWGNGRSELHVLWTTEFYGAWESGAGPIDDGALTVTDKDGTEVYTDDTDPSGWSEPFPLEEFSHTKQMSGNGTQTETKKDYNPYNFELQKVKLARTYTNMTSESIDMPAQVTMTLDDVPPILTITSPSEGTLVNVTQITVTGLTEKLSTVKVNGKNATVLPDGSFGTTIDLVNEGLNAITVVTTDKGKNEVTRTVNVTLDTTIPVLNVEGPVQDGLYNSLTISVKGATEPDALVTVQGQNVTVDQNGTFETQVVFTDQGQNLVTLTSTDPAGNTRTKVINISIDIVPPPLIISKPANNTLTREPTIDVLGSTEKGSKVTVNDLMVFFDGSLFDTTVSLDEGINLVTIISTDAAGNSATVVRTVTRDSTPPHLEIATPAPNLRTPRTSITVSGTAEAGAVVKINGIEVPNIDGNYSDIVFLTDGSNKITVEATDAAGNVATRTVRVYKEVGTGPTDPVTVTEPANNTVTTDKDLTIKGLTDGPGTVTVNGVETTLDESGTFDKNITLNEGLNKVVISYVDAFNETHVVTWYITLDTTPPAITITEPGSKVGTANVLVKGMTEPGATVTVNGLFVYVTPTGGFTAPVNLNPGKNVILVTAVDDAGNANTQQVEVKFEDKEATGGIVSAASPATLGLMAMMLVLLIVVVAMMAMMMSRMRPPSEKRTVLDEEDEDEVDEGEDDDGDEEDAGEDGPKEEERSTGDKEDEEEDDGED